MTVKPSFPSIVAYRIVMCALTKLSLHEKILGRVVETLASSEKMSIEISKWLESLETHPFYATLDLLLQKLI